MSGNYLKDNVARVCVWPNVAMSENKTNVWLFLIFSIASPVFRWCQHLCSVNWSDSPNVPIRAGHDVIKSWQRKAAWKCSGWQWRPPGWRWRETVMRDFWGQHLLCIHSFLGGYFEARMTSIFFHFRKIIRFLYNSLLSATAGFQDSSCRLQRQFYTSTVMNLRCSLWRRF
jgi:hypothetical protein